MNPLTLFLGSFVVMLVAVIAVGGGFTSFGTKVIYSASMAGLAVAYAAHLGGLA